MDKNLCLKILLSFALLPNIAQAAEVVYNTTDAGVVLSKSDMDTLPTGYVEPLNLTDAANVIPAEEESEENPEIYFSADEMQNDQQLGTITAIGNVDIIRDNVAVKADKIIYNQKEDIITAVGNVVILNEDGTVAFSDYVVLSDKMKKGEMDNIKVIMKDKSQIAANKVRKFENDDKEMENAVYSPCNICTGQDPLWQLKAKKITHDAKSKNMYYQDAFLEVKGVPVFYTPFFAHPDPTVKRRSGFLIPNIASSSYLGAAIQPQYFWAVSDHEDVLFSPTFSTDKGIVWGGKYNKYTYRGELHAEGSMLVDQDDDDNRRGNLFLKGRYEVNDFWVADADINYSSDRNYLKDMSLSLQDDAWLTSSLKMQGFDNRNYASIEGYYYQLNSYDMKEYDKPLVLPMLNYENISEPGKYGAYTKTNLTTQGIGIIFRKEFDKWNELLFWNRWKINRLKREQAKKKAAEEAQKEKAATTSKDK